MKRVLYPVGTALGAFIYGPVGAVVGLCIGLAIDHYYRKVF